MRGYRNDVAGIDNYVWGGRNNVLGEENRVKGK